MSELKSLFIHDDVSPPLLGNNSGTKWIGTYNLKTTEYITEETKWVAAVHPYDCNGFPYKDEALEYARLFAAAPDLLKAALMVQTYFRKLDHGFVQELTDCSNAINKAIDKAILPPPRYTHDCDECCYLGR